MFRHTAPIKQLTISIALVLLVAFICYFISDYLGYRVVAFVLLLVVSFIALVFDIIPVLAASFLSAMIWNFFFIPPKFTFHIGNAEDLLLFLMYFAIALINAVLINRLRLAEKQIFDKEEKAKSLKLYNTLLNCLSHELKTPVASIVGAADNLMQEPQGLTNENRKELVAGISAAALRLNQQVENLLSMSRLEAGFLQLKKDWCDMNELVYEVINRLHEQLKNHELHIKIPPDLPLFKLDYILMEQVIYNLLYNISLYTPEYSEVFVTVNNHTDKVFELRGSEDINSSVKKEKSLLYITVEDRGPGFPPQAIEKAFDKFYRIDHTKTGGTGLGLSIVKGFVEAHEGTVSLENVPHGARFTIQIPCETSYINLLKNE